MNDSGPVTRPRKEYYNMKEIEVGKLDKLSNLSVELQRVEGIFIHSQSAELTQARNSVVGALQTFKNNRLNLGRVLRVYKRNFKAEGSWMAAVKVIADAIERDERTVFRIIEDFERASQLAPIVLEAMQEQKIDPAAKKNAGVVENLLQMPKPETREDADTAVSVAVRAHVAEKKKRKKAATKPAKMGFEEFAVGIVRQFEDRYRSRTPQETDAEIQFVLELVVCTLRANIRELGQYDQPALVPKPAIKNAA
jgi:hypothetical protein